MIAQRKCTGISGISTLAALALVLSGSTASAQNFEFARCEDDAPYETVPDDSLGVPRNQCVQRSAFRLFGTADFAGSGMRSAAADVVYFTTNTGFSDTGKELQGETLPFGVRGTAQNPGAWSWQNFEIQFWAAAARGDWVRNKEIATSLENVTGGGWTYTLNTKRLGGYHQWAGHDGSIGLYHSGQQSASGGGCLEHGGGYPGFPNGFPLLAANDCPETWGSGSLTWGAYTPRSGDFQGRGWVGPVDNWVEYFNDVGPDNFNFDFWNVPQQYYSDKTAIGDFQVFGIMSDHGGEYAARYGSVIPGMSGDPQLEGYPIGLDVNFNAFSFKIPSVARGFIWEGLIINNSAEVYGVPLDYDSLFFGMMIRPLRTGSGIGGGRRANPHAIPELGAVVHNELGRTPDCDGALAVPQSIDCTSPRNRTPGFSGGAEGSIILKSPIGDLRNKLLSDPTSPFYAPANPNAGDTITFNRMSMCSYRCTIQNFIFDARKGYGILAASPRDALDGRDPKNDLSPFQRWELFHQFYAPDGSERFCDPNNPREPGCFGYTVPGDWSYTNRPPGTVGGPDTLWIDNCRPPTDVGHPGANQCTGLWADTLPDRTLNWTQNVIWPGVGPFPLAAGDTTSFVVVTFAAPDSAGLMASLEAFYNFYVNDFYLGPGLPSPSNITSVSTTGGSARLGQASITLFLDDAAEDWVDPFALKALAELRNPAPGTIFDQIVRADPTAPDSLEAQIRRTNVDSIYIYKSCDRGRSFTSDRTNWDCEPSPARNSTGQPLGTGWQAWSALTPQDGAFQSTFRDNIVASGQTYLYSLVAHTPGIHLSTQYWADTDGDGVEDEIRDTTITILPAGSSVFTANPGEAFVTEVYVPASRQAGSELAIATLVSREGPVPWTEDHVAIILQQDAQTEGQFSLVFGNDAVVTAYRTSLETVDSTVILLEQSVRARMPDVSLQEVVYDTLQFRSTEPAGILLGTTGNAVETVTSNGAVITVTEFNDKTGIVLDSNGAPIFVSSRLQAGQFTPGALLNHPLSPQFIVDVDDDPGAWVRDFWAIDDPDDADNFGWTLDEDLRGRSDPSVGWLQGSSNATDLQLGLYVIDFEAEIYGTPLPEVNVFDPEETRSEFWALLEARSTLSRAEVSQEVVDAIQRDLDPAVELDSLIAAELPFKVYNLAFGAVGVGTPVRVAMLARSKLDAILLGNPPDTVTAAVPPVAWVPGERLIFLEEVELAQTNPDGTLQLDGSGQPVMASELAVTWSTAMLGCDDPRPTCNPVSGPRLAAVPGYVEARPNGNREWPNGWDLNAVYKNPFTSQTRFLFEVSPARSGYEVRSVTKELLDSVLVVPNPYIGRSAYEVEGNVRRLMFTHLPPDGTIQIFTATGQFLQRIKWTPDELSGNGDLFWNMQTREGNLIASGLYIFIVEANDPETGRYLKKLGKFIVIR